MISESEFFEKTRGTHRRLMEVLSNLEKAEEASKVGFLSSDLATQIENKRRALRETLQRSLRDFHAQLDRKAERAQAEIDAALADLSRTAAARLATGVDFDGAVRGWKAAASEALGSAAAGRRGSTLTSLLFEERKNDLLARGLHLCENMYKTTEEMRGFAAQFLGSLKVECRSPADDAVKVVAPRLESIPASGLFQSELLIEGDPFAAFPRHQSTTLDFLADEPHSRPRPADPGKSLRSLKSFSASKKKLAFARPESNVLNQTLHRQLFNAEYGRSRSDLSHSQSRSRIDSSRRRVDSSQPRPTTKHSIKDPSLEDTRCFVAFEESSGSKVLIQATARPAPPARPRPLSSVIRSTPTAPASPDRIARNSNSNGLKKLLAGRHAPLLRELGRNKAASLDLSGGGLVDSDLTALAPLLSTAKLLTSIKLARNTITDEGVASLCHALLGSQVSLIDLSFNEVSMEGIPFLAKLAKTNRRLKSLNLKRNRIEAKEKQKLIAEFKALGCSIEL